MQTVGTVLTYLAERRCNVHTRYRLLMMMIVFRDKTKLATFWSISRILLGLQGPRADEIVTRSPSM